MSQLFYADPMMWTPWAAPGISVADLVRRDNNLLVVRGLDALDKTPVVDIKCYSPGIDCIPE
jgi:tRNA (Thr-GGU) A37 N-methylase